MPEKAAKPYAVSVNWKNHRQRVIADGVRVDEDHCAECGQPWPCDVAQAWENGYQRGLHDGRDDD